MRGALKGNAQVVSRTMSPYVRTWTAWYTLPPSQLRSPSLLITTNSENHNQESIIGLMMEKSYRCDTPFLWAKIALKSSGSRLNSLIRSYPDVNACISYDDLWDRETMPKDKESSGLTALHIAIFSGRLDVARLLIKRGADVNQRKAKGSNMEKKLPKHHSCLQIAVKELDVPTQEEAIQLLLDAGADLNAPASWDSGATALQFVTIKGELSLARRLINLGADINAPRALHRGRTCLEGAAENGKLDMVQYLLNAGADTEGTGRLQYIHAINLAEAEGHYAIVDLLRAYRSWDSSDEALFKDLSVARNQRREIMIVHPEERSAEAFASLRSWCHNHRKDIRSVIPKPLVWPHFDSDSSAQERLCSEEEQSVNWEDWIEDDMLI
ncbi:ankyrin repeat-containing domain protein [Nemania serpens]|nr:ankyrin repeat-containing domain protein [Nemania serpens]